jgi:hypothetical protein
MHFWIDIKFTKILGQFEQKKICRFDSSWHAIISFKNIYLSLFIVYYSLFNTLLNKF